MNDDTAMDDVEQRLNRLTPRGVRPELRGQVFEKLASELEIVAIAPKEFGIFAAESSAPKEPSSPSPGQRPGEIGRTETAFPAQRANRSANHWPVGPTEEQDQPGSPGRCPGLGERQGLRPTEPISTGVGAAKIDSPWLGRSAWAVAASLVLGIGLNIWAAKASERRMAQLFGPPPISKQAMEIAKAIEEITDAETGRWVYQRLAAPRRSGDASAAYTKHYAAMEQLISELNVVSKDSYHETLQKDSEVDRDRARRIDGDTSDCQRLVRLDYRCTA